MADVYRLRSSATVWEAGMGGDEPHHQVSYTPVETHLIILSCWYVDVYINVHVVLQISSSAVAPSLPPVCGEHIRRLQGLITHSTSYNLLCLIMSITLASVWMTSASSLCAGHPLFLHPAEFISCCQLHNPEGCLQRGECEPHRLLLHSVYYDSWEVNGGRWPWLQLQTVQHCPCMRVCERALHWPDTLVALSLHQQKTQWLRLIRLVLLFILTITQKL